MPIYEFQCQKCGHSFDALLPMSKAEEVQICPQCGEHSGLRVFAGFGAYSVRGNNQASVSPKSTVRKHGDE